MRATLIVLDSVGVGAMPDAADWGDAGADTLGHTAQVAGGLALPNLGALGLGCIHPVAGVPPVERPGAGWGRMALRSPGKDSVTGHWELAGCIRHEPFGYFHQGFPPAIMEPFEAASGKPSLGNIAASGTVIIDQLGAEHLRTGSPIVYTSADSVFQIAAHEEVIPLPELYALCERAFEIVSPHQVARVIARPFLGQPGSFQRTENRKDFSMQPDRDTLLDLLLAAGQPVTGVGKVSTLYGGRGFQRTVKAGNNEAVTDRLLEVLDQQSAGLIFANLVDFDMLYGHRRDPAGYARALEAFDRRLPSIMERLGADDLLLITADHGNDPVHSGSDHTREYVPVLAWRHGNAGPALGLRHQLADAGATIAEHLGLAAGGGRVGEEGGRTGLAPLVDGESFLPQLQGRTPGVSP